jgi:hypothetical protein
MSWIDRALAFLRREAADVSEAVRDLEARADADLARRERELQATPEERLADIQREIDDAGDPFGDVRAKLDAMQLPPPEPPPPGAPGRGDRTG